MNNSESFNRNAETYITYYNHHHHHHHQTVLLKGRSSHGRLARWRKWRACDVVEAKEGLENELWSRWSVGRVEEWRSSFSNLSVTPPTSQLILQPFRRFTYVTARSTTIPVPHIRHRHHLRHSSFSNPSAASYTSQLILQPFRCFTYVTGTSLTSSDEPPMHRGMKKQAMVD